jgi:hypothetical protein
MAFVSVHRMRTALGVIVLLVGCADDSDIDFCEPVPTDKHVQTFQLAKLDCLEIHITAECEDPTCCMSNVQTEVESVCHGGCFDHDEAACEADSHCFEVLDPVAFYKGTDAFVGCYEDDNSTAEPTPCHARNSVYDCVHRDPNGGRCAPMFMPGGLTYIGCVAETDVADACDAPVTCADAPPSCGSGEVPAIVNGCYDGCIEQDWCR